MLDAALCANDRYGGRASTWPRGLMTVKFQRVLSFWARTAPRTPIQRVGAAIIGINSILCSAIVLVTIVDAYSVDWTTSGVTSSAFGVGVVLLLLPIGIAHGLAAVFPQVLDPWKPDPNEKMEKLKRPFADRVRDMYLVVGWFTLICIVALLVYFLVV